MDDLDLWDNPEYTEAIDKGIHPIDLQDFNQDKRRLVQIIGYLEAGAVYSVSGGYSYCRFGCGIPSVNMGDADLFDGTYVWPQGSSHYLKEHSIKLPEYFTEHIKKNNYMVNVRKQDYDKEIAIDKWYQWCQKQRKTSFKEIEWSVVDNLDA